MLTATYLALGRAVEQDSPRQMAAPSEWALEGQAASRKAAEETILGSEWFRSLASVLVERVTQGNQPL